MADEVLSQSQIDELLRGMREEQNEKPKDTEETKSASSVQTVMQKNARKKEADIFSSRKIKNYDFKSPKKFTKEQLRLLDRVYESFARVLSSYLTSALRYFTAVEVMQIEEQRYFEFANALPDSTIISLIEMSFKEEDDIDEATLIMNAPLSFGYFCVDRLLGGQAENYNVDRSFTDIEFAIINNVFTAMVGFLGDVFSKNVTATTKLTSLEDNPRTVQTFSPDDIVVIVSLNVTIKSLDVPFMICMPALNIEKIVKKFNGQYEKTYKKPDPLKDEKRKKNIMGSLFDSDLTVKAVLHETTMDVNDILYLQKGDVILLNKPVGSDVKVTVNDVPWFSGSIGTLKHKKAVRINKLYEGRSD